MAVAAAFPGLSCLPCSSSEAQRGVGHRGGHSGHAPPFISAFSDKNAPRVAGHPLGGGNGSVRVPSAALKATGSQEEVATEQQQAEGSTGDKRKGAVATLFDSSFEYTSWYEVFRTLTAIGLRSIEPSEAAAMVYDSTIPYPPILIDVREAEDYAQVHAKGAVNAPLFRLIQGSDLKANIRRLGYGLMGDFKGTERNPLLLEQVQAAVGGDRQRAVVVMCARGGTLQNVSMRKGMEFRDPDKRFGLQSRSLKACYELHQAGFTNILHVNGGFNLWLHLDLPSEP